MKLNKTQKDLLLKNIDVEVDEKDNKVLISWSSGKASYNIDMKPTWSKEQQIEINDIKSDVKDLKQDMVEVKSNIKLIIDILARNGMK